MRLRLFAVLSLAACGSSGKTGPEPAATPTPVAEPTPTTTPFAGKPSKAQVNSEPDKPAGAAAARDAELAKGAAALLDAFVNSAPTLSRDGKKVIFTSNRDGLPQLYVADAAKVDGPATRLTVTKERIVGAQTTKDGKSVIFRSDKGADENWDIFRVDLDGKNLTQLTSGEPLNRDGAHLPDAKADAMFYSARKMSEAASTIYAQPLQAGAAPRKVFTDPGFGVLADVSTDGKWGAWLRVPSRTRATVLIVDTATGQEKVVYPTSGEVAIEDASFSRDGKLLYVSTDGGGDQALVLAFDTKTLKEVARYAETKPATGVITHFAASKKGNLLALNVLAGNHSEVRLLDGTTLKAKTELKLPLGSGSITGFSEDGKRLTLDRSMPGAPSDIFVIDVATGNVAPLRKEPRPSAPELPAVETQLVEIAAHDGLKIPTNVYLPAGATGKKLPVIVSYHGGPAGASVVRWDPIARFFSTLGYAWVEPNVRGSSGFGRAFEMADNGPQRSEAFKDVEAVARWVGSQSWADRTKLVVYGGSYGGYTTLIALTRQPDLWSAGVDLFGIANLPTFLKTTSGTIRELFKTEFGDLEKDAALLEEQSPLRQVDKIVDPLFVYAGANDPRVPKSESDLIVQALRERNVPVEYMVANDEGHSLVRRENRMALAARVARFLETQLTK